MKRILPLLFAVILLAGCKKDKITAPSVTGRWELRQEVGGNGTVNISYPEGNGHIYQFNSNNTYRLYTNNAVTDSGTYSIQARAVTVDHIQYNTITFNGTKTQVVQVVQNTLSLGLTYNGSTADLYYRVN